MDLCGDQVREGCEAEQGKSQVQKNGANRGEGPKRVAVAA